jgi:hypothetical protein
MAKMISEMPAYSELAEKNVLAYLVSRFSDYK